MRIFFITHTRTLITHITSSLSRINPSFYIIKFYLSLALLSLALIYLSLTTAPRVSAQSVGLSISPPQIEILLQPNTRVIHSFDIVNQGETINLIPKIEAVVPTDTFGHIAISETPLNLSETGLTITILNNDIFLDQPFTLAKGQSTQIVVRIESAPASDPIDNYLALTLSPDISFDNTTPSTAPKIASLIFTSTLPLDTQPISLEIEDWGLPVFHDSTRPLIISPIIKNSSSTMIRPTGKIKVTNFTGKTILEETIYPHLILSNHSRSLQSIDNSSEPPSAIPFALEKKLLTGPHTIELTLTTESGKEILTDSVNVFLLPVQIIIYVIIVSLLFIVVFSQLSRTRSENA